MPNGVVMGNKHSYKVVHAAPGYLFDDQTINAWFFPSLLPSPHYSHFFLILTERPLQCNVLTYPGSPWEFGLDASFQCTALFVLWTCLSSDMTSFLVWKVQWW